MLIIAQRVSTIVHADQIIVLEDGHLKGRGAHEELMRTCATYQDIARSQMRAEDLAEFEARAAADASAAEAGKEETR